MSTATALQLVGTIVGGAVGGPVGAAIGGTVGALVGNAIAPTAVASPGLNDLKLQRSQYGNPIPYVWGRFRVGGNVDWIGNGGELVQHGGGGGGKGGGGGDSGPTYTGAWSMIFCKSTRKGQDALVAIDKWWTDGRVVNYDDINPTVYIGHAQQLPDSSMEADLGAGRVSADRFKGKAVFNDVQMGQFFNRLPNMEGLVRTKGQTNGAIVQLAKGNADIAFAQYPALSGAWPIDWENTGTLPEPTGVVANPYLYISDGWAAHRLANGASGYALVVGVPTWVALYWDYCNAPQFAPIGAGPPYTIPGLAGRIEGDTTYWVDVCAVAGVETGRFVYSWAVSTDGHIIIVVTNDDNITPTDWKWHRIVDGIMTAEGPVEDDGVFVTSSPRNIGNGHSGDNIGNVVKGVVESNGQYIWTFKTNGGYAYNVPAPGENEESVALYYIDTADNTLKQYVGPTQFESLGGPDLGSAHSGLIYSPAEGYAATLAGGYTQYSLYTRLAGTAQLTLAEILADVFELRDGLSPSQFDVTAAASTLVHGAALASVMQKRNFIDALRQAYFFDVVESDDGDSTFLKVVMRDRVEPEDGWPEIPDDDLGVREDGEDSQPLLALLSRVQEAELPARVNVQYYDPDQDYQIGSQSAQWNSPYVDNVTRIDLPIAMYSGEARTIAKRHLATARLERNRYGFSTSRKWAHLEPTDIVTVRGMLLRVLQKTETPKGVIRWEAVQHAPYIATQIEDGAPADGTTPIPPSGPKVATQVKFFDVAKVFDDHLDVGFYIAAAGELGGSWSGYSLQKSVDGGTTWAEVASTNVATIMGTVAQPIGGFTGGNVFDYSTVIRVTNVTGALESVSELAALNGDNAFVIGNEIGNFTTATQVDATTWDVTGLLRGRRGTEWAMTTHGTDETFALVSTMLNVATPEAEVGQARQYKAVSFGMTLAGTMAVTFTNTAQSARCYAPVHVAGGPTASDAVLMECVPRTRSGGAWRDFVDIAQADAPLDLVLEIWDATYTSCARVVSGLSSPSYSYSSADQVTDFGAEQSTYYVTWAQVGRFGLGLRARGTVSGPGSTIDAPADPGDPYEPPVDPPVGGGGTDIVLTYPADTDHSTGTRIGDTIVIKFTTSATPGDGYISVGTYSGTQYALHIVLATDIAGTSPVAEAYGAAVATIQLGDLYSYSVELDPSTDYYLRVKHETSPGNPSGTPGQPTNIAVTLFTE